MEAWGRNTTTRRRRLGAGTAATTAVLTTALGLAIAPAGPAQAAGLGWNPQEHGLEFLPTSVANGEITVTQVKNDDASARAMASFAKDGTAVTYATQLSARDHQWGPAGDVVLGTVPPSSDPTFTIVETNSPKEYLRAKAVPAPAQWSPSGDSIVTTDRVSGGYQPSARWIGSGRTDTLAKPQATDPGTPTALPDGWGALVAVPSADVAGKRDLGFIAAEFPRLANKALHSQLSDAQGLGFGALDARLPTVAADGTLAFVGTGEKGPALFVVEDDGVPVAVSDLGADCAGQRPSFAPSTGAIAYLFSSADCSSTELRVLERASGTFVGGTDTLVATSPSGRHFETASWRPKTPAAGSTRLGGKDRIATGIAVSKWGWEGGSEGAVLTSSASFADAVVAGPLAGQAWMPLLVNGPTTLDSRVLTELKRLMPDARDRFVYVVGGTGSLSSSVQKSLQANGFSVRRLAGSDRYTTSVAVAREMDLVMDDFPEVPRTSAFLADGRNFPDALSAGPAAATFFAPVLLTNGTTVPASVKGYVNGRSQIHTVYSIGGTAAKASSAFGSRATGYGVYGKDRYETSAATAKRFFPGAWAVGYASGTSFPDALTGGAMMASAWEPLVLTAPTALSAPAAVLANDYRSSTDLTLVFGGAAVVSDAVKNDVRSRAGQQTALFGWDVAVAPNPDFPETFGHGHGAGSSPALNGRNDAPTGDDSRADAANAYRAAAQR